MLWELLPVLYVPYLRGIGVQITKEQLKQIIKEEVRAVQLEILRGRPARTLIGNISNAIVAQGPEMARDWVEQLLELYSSASDEEDERKEAGLFITDEKDFLEAFAGSLQYKHMPRNTWPYQKLFWIAARDEKDKDVLDALTLEIQSNAEFYGWKFQAIPHGDKLILKVLT